MEGQEQFLSTTKMYAIIENNVVIDSFIGTYKKALKKYKNCAVIEMTLENSPAYTGGRWDGTKFYEPERQK